MLRGCKGEGYGQGNQRCVRVFILDIHSLNFSIDSRTFLTASFRSLLRTYVMSSPNERMPEALVTLLSSPRIRLVDLSYLDDSSGTTMLHEAAKRKDLRGIELAVRAGADVFVRDRRGRNVIESVGKDDRVKVFLRQCTSLPSTSLYASLTDPTSHSCQSRLDTY